RAMNMAPFIFWNLAFYTIIRTQLKLPIHDILPYMGSLYMKKILLSAFAAFTGCSFLLSPGSVDARVSNSEPGNIIYIAEERISPRSIPTPGGSFTLVEHMYKTYGNGETVGAIATSVGIAFKQMGKAAGVPGHFIAVGVAAISGWIKNQLEGRLVTYAELRLGISYNTYYGYYEYVETVTHYSDGSFSKPKQTQYVQTGYKVPDDILARYGLKNP
ncbi:hypothetical protein ABNB88_12660, partial [Paenibacillus larvae]